MKNIFGFIIVTLIVKSQAWESPHNCSHLYLIVEETIRGHELIPLDEVDLNLLDPGIPRNCYLGLTCDSFIDPTPIVPTRYSYHTVVPDIRTINKDHTDLTSTEPVTKVTEAPRTITTDKNIDTLITESTSIGPSTTNDRATVTETSRNITTGINTTTSRTTPITISTADDRITVTETRKNITTTKTTTTKGTTPTVTSATDDVVTVTETPRFVTTFNNTTATSNSPESTYKTATDAPNFNYSTNYPADKFNNKHLTINKDTDKCQECLMSILRNNAGSIILVLSLLAIGIFACNMICYIVIKQVGRCLRKKPGNCASNSYDVSRY